MNTQIPQNQRVVSGMRPTGKLHLGHYHGVLKNWAEMQLNYECFFFVADWHALTTHYDDPSGTPQHVEDMVIDWLAAGISPSSATIFLQSEVPEHAELHLLFSMITPLSWLERCPTYKDQLTQMDEKNIRTYGFLGYPCLQSADILIYKADYVPVGEDQLPHVEMTREIARRFNFIYDCKVFPEPEPLLTEAKVLPGLDGRKMSKSYNNTIALKDRGDVLRKKVMSMITDPARIKKDDPGHPDVCAVFAYHKLFNKDEVEQIECDCKAGAIGCVGCKKNLYSKLVDVLKPIHERRSEIENNPKMIQELLLWVGI